jgi:prevent-host-death family protein
MYISGSGLVYTCAMDVAVTALRAHLGEWLERARAGEDVVVTDRGLPVARLVGLDATTLIEQLTRDGLISRPARSPRPSATGRRRVPARGSVSELVSTQRR